MNILQDVSLKDYSTMRLGGKAAYMVDVHERNEVVGAVEWAESQKLPFIVVGGGSNIVWKDEGFPGLVIVNKIMRFEEQNEDGENYYVTVGAGENWDSVVERVTAKGATGIECLSLIPGTAGATPVQNVGAYGQEVKDTIATIEVYDSKEKRFNTLQAFECGFGYRTSRFKTVDRGRFVIISVTFHLRLSDPAEPYYAAIDSYLKEHNIQNPTPMTLRYAVKSIRMSKLPDPAEVANNGSFFANPIVDLETYNSIISANPNAPSWHVGANQFKIPAAWLIEQAGFKDFHDSETGMGTWPSQPLVMVNESAKTTADLIAFKQKIVDGVQEKFGITLEQEPELLPL